MFGSRVVRQYGGQMCVFLLLELEGRYGGFRNREARCPFPWEQAVVLKLRERMLEGCQVWTELGALRWRPWGCRPCSEFRVLVACSEFRVLVAWRSPGRGRAWRAGQGGQVLADQTLRRGLLSTSHSFIHPRLLSDCTASFPVPRCSTLL